MVEVEAVVVVEKKGRGEKEVTLLPAMGALVVAMVVTAMLSGVAAVEVAAVAGARVRARVAVAVLLPHPLLPYSQRCTLCPPLKLPQPWLQSKNALHESLLLSLKRMLLLHMLRLRWWREGAFLAAATSAAALDMLCCLPSPFVTMWRVAVVVIVDTHHLRTAPSLCG